MMADKNVFSPRLTALYSQDKMSPGYTSQDVLPYALLFTPPSV